MAKTDRIDLAQYGYGKGASPQEIAKQLTADIDKHNKKVKQDKEKRAKDEVKEISKFVARSHAKKTKYFFFGH